MKFPPGTFWRRPWICVPLLLIAVLWLPAAVARAAGTNLAAVQAWAALTNRSLPMPPDEWQTNAPTDEQLAKFRQIRAVQAGSAADQAREFYTRFSSDANANPARAAELRMLQLAVQLGATNRLAALAACEEDLLKIPDLSEADRYSLRIDLINRQLELAGANQDAMLEKAGHDLVREFPFQGEGYRVLLMVARASDPPKARELLRELLTSNAPPEVQITGQSLLKQLEAVGKPLDIRFAAVDGRPVDLATMTNKVVLVDFWATWCPPCVALVPEVKAVYDKFHAHGLEIVGISLDNDKAKLQHFVADQHMPWPQYFDGQGWQNKFTPQLGIDALPALWLVDKKGVVRYISANGGLEAKVGKLLAE